MNAPLETAFAEACLALGESIVRERLLLQELARLAPPTSDDIVIPTQGEPAQEEPDDG